jgi:hypothetical protein
MSVLAGDEDARSRGCGLGWLPLHPATKARAARAPQSGQHGKVTAPGPAGLRRLRQRRGNEGIVRHALQIRRSFVAFTWSVRNDLASCAVDPASPAIRIRGRWWLRDARAPACRTREPVMASPPRKHRTSADHDAQVIQQTKEIIARSLELLRRTAHLVPRPVDTTSQTPKGRWPRSEP